MKIETKVVGLAELRLKIDGLKKSVVNKHARRAMTHTVRDVAKKFKAVAWKRTGLYKKSVGSKIKTYKGTTVVGVIGARHGFKKQVGVRLRGKNKGKAVFQDPAKYGHLAEAKVPKLAPHWNSVRSEAEKMFAEKMAESLETEGKK